MGGFLQDLRLAVRMSLRRPWFSGIAVLVLAVGIGLTTTMFAIVQGVLLRGLPFENPEQLLALRRNNLSQGIEEMSVTIHDFADWRAAQTSFEDLSAYYTGTVNVSGTAGRPERYSGAFVTSNMFGLLRVQPALGRAFREGEDHPSAEQVAIISHSTWRDRFDRNPDVLGHVIRANGEPMTIVGVMPERFAFPNNEDLWIPLRVDPLALQRGQGSTYLVFGRLHDGVSLNEAQTELSAIAQRLGTQYPETNDGVGVFVMPYIDWALGPEATILLFTMQGAVFGVLFIACANVANLLLARATLRTRELAIRSTLGASRLRVVWQLLAEAFVLAAVGGILSFAIARVGVNVFGDAIADSNPPFWMDITIDPTVVLFVVGLIGLSTVAAGVVPAMRASRADVNAILKDESRGSTSIRLGRFSRVLVVVELALSCAVITATGLTIKSVMNIEAARVAFPTEDVFTARMTLFASDYPDADRLRRFWEDLETRLKDKPGVRSVGLASSPPALGAGQVAFSIEGRTYPSDRDYPLARQVVVTPGFFDTFESRMREGRNIRATDEAGSMPVILVNESFVRRFFPGELVLGKRIRLGRANTTRPWMTIIGVVPDLWPQGLEQDDHEGVYVPLAQNLQRSMSLVIRSHGAPLDLTSMVRTEVLAMDADLPIYQVRTLAQAIEDTVWEYWLAGALFLAFGVAAVFMAVIGLYGVMAFSVGQRTNEIGLRMALGARSWDVLVLFLRQGIVQVGMGLLLGLGLAVGLARLIQPLLIGVEPWDPAVFAAIGVTLGITGLLACFIPARRATMVDPMVALRYE